VARYSSAQHATALFGRNLSGYYKSLTLSGKYCLSLPFGQLIAQNLADWTSWLLPRYRRDIISVQSLKVINFVIKTPRPFCIAAKLRFIRMSTLNRHWSAEPPPY